MEINDAAYRMLQDGDCAVVHILPDAPVPPAGRGSYNHLLFELGLLRASTDLVVSSFSEHSWSTAAKSRLGVVQIAGRRNHLTDSLLRAVLARTPGFSAKQRHDLRLGRTSRLLSRKILTPAAPQVVCLWGDLRWARLLRNHLPEAFIVFAQRHHRLSSPHWGYYLHVDEVVFLTETARQLAISDAFVSEQNSLSIRNGIDLRLHHPPSPEQRSAARKVLGVSDDALVFLMPSTLSEQKGVFHAIRWFKIIERTLADLDPVLILAGIVHPTMSREDVDRLDREIETPSIVALRGVPAELMPSMFASADICLHPSVNEGFGLAIVEAMATGLPVVAVDSGGVTELIDSGINGVLLADRSDDQQAASVLLELARNVSLRDRLGEAARKTAFRFTREEAVATWSHYLDTRTARNRAC